MVEKKAEPYDSELRFRLKSYFQQFVVIDLPVVLGLIALIVFFPYVVERLVVRYGDITIIANDLSDFSERNTRTLDLAFEQLLDFKRDVSLALTEPFKRVVIAFTICYLFVSFTISVLLGIPRRILWRVLIKRKSLQRILKKDNKGNQA